MSDPLIGRRLGKYLIQQEIGRGGMARVYRASDTVLQRPVALKVLAPSLSADPEFARRFEREAITAANLRHPAIVTIFDVGEADGLRYIAMEYIAGRTLNEVLQEQGRLGIPLTIALLAPVAEALDFAHSHGMIHRDVKPHNIMIDADGRVLLTDFGIAIDPNESGERLTRTGMFMGTPEYISPEQAQAQPLTGRSDLYSLGIVAYEMLAGRVPFEGATPQQIMAHVYQAPPPITSFDRATPPEIDQIFARVLAKDPAQRFEQAGKLVEALRYVARRYNLPAATRNEVAALAVPRGSSAGQATVAMRTPPAVSAAPEPTPQRATPPEAQAIQDVFGGSAPARRASPTPQPGNQDTTLPMRTTPPASIVATGGRSTPSGRATGGTRQTAGRGYPTSGDFAPSPRIPRRPGYDDRGSNVPWTLLALGAIAVVAIALIFVLTRDNGLFAATPVPSRNPFEQPTVTITPTATPTPSATIPFPTLVPPPASVPPEEGITPTATIEPTVVPTIEPTTAPTTTSTPELPTATPTLELPTATPTTAPTATPTESFAVPTDQPSSTTVADASPSSAPAGVPTPIGGGGSIAYFSGDALQVLDPATGQQPESFNFKFDMQGPAAISPDGRTILVDLADATSQERHIFAIDRATGVPTQLTRGQSVDFDATWRPDGQAIVFASTRNGQTDIYIMNADGSSQRALTNDPGASQYPSFSPDGTRILFESTRDGPNWAMYSMDLQGGAVTRLSPQSNANDRAPRWSPDGQQIAFVSNRDRTDGNFELYTMRSDGTNPQRLTEFTNGSINGPTWSPDGTLIACFGNDTGNNDIYVVDIAADKLLPAPATPNDERWPSWSK